MRFPVSRFDLNRSLLARLLLIAPFFFWGTAMVAMKGTLPHTTPLFVATLRLVPAGLLILLVAWSTGRPGPRGWQAWAWILGFAGVDGTLFQGFLAEGLQRTDAGLGSVMIDSQPLAVALLASWLFQERIGLWGALGLLLGITGISFLGLPDEWLVQAAHALVQHLGVGSLGSWDGGAPGPLLLPAGVGWDVLFQNGQWLMLLASLSMAVGTILSRYVSRWVDPVMATGWHMLLGGLPLLWLSATQEAHQWEALTWTDWSALAYSTVFGSAIAYGLFFYFAAQGSLTSLSALTFLTPVFALLFGNLFLQEVLTGLQQAGVALTLVSIFLINQRESLTPWFLAWFPPQAALSSGNDPDSPKGFSQSLTESSTEAITSVGSTPLPTALPKSSSPSSSDPTLSPSSNPSPNAS